VSGSGFVNRTRKVSGASCSLEHKLGTAELVSKPGLQLATHNTNETAIIRHNPRPSNYESLNRSRSTRTGSTHSGESLRELLATLDTSCSVSTFPQWGRFCSSTSRSIDIGPDTAQPTAVERMLRYG
jgi:hypothetical protein